MKHQLDALLSRTQSAGYGGDSSVPTILNVFEGKGKGLELFSLTDNKGRLLATLMLRPLRPGPRSTVQRVGMLCISAPQSGLLQAGSRVYRFNGIPLMKPGKANQSQVAKVFEAEAGFQYAEFYEGPLIEGVNDTSYFFIDGEILTAHDHLLFMRDDKKLERLPGFNEVCDRMGWRLKQIWSEM